MAKTLKFIRLKTCPFCGKPPNEAAYYIGCVNPSCPIKVQVTTSNRREAAKMWNTRKGK